MDKRLSLVCSLVLGGFLCVLIGRGESLRTACGRG